MESSTFTRPSRRAAARKQLVVDNSDEEVAHSEQKQDDSEEDFTPVPQRSPKRQSRRTTTGPPPTPRAAGRRGRPKTAENLEPSHIFDPDETITSTPASPTKRGSPRKRKSVAPPGQSRVGASTDTPNMDINKPLVILAPPKPQGTPLGDITNAVVNEQPAPSIDAESWRIPIKPLNTVMERPMDIVVRTRALGAPPTQEPAGLKSRMIIKFLALTNFKSYAGRQLVGPFHVSFSSVVGPNGSGKSNVIDSLLFVFGFRASKMRQGKISALIHHSAACPDLDFCEVEVHFEEVMDLVCDLQPLNFRRILMVD